MTTKPRKARFKVDGTFDGTKGATITVTTFGNTSLVEVRPTRRRETYSATLDQIASWVIFEDVKKRLGSKGPVTKVKRGLLTSG